MCEGFAVAEAVAANKHNNNLEANHEGALLSNGIN